MIAVIDYDAGNLLSVVKALDYLGFENKITDDESIIKSSDAVILPGVGAFPDAMKSLREKGLDRILKEEAKRKPLLGICLGMQLLFDKSYEFCECDGLGLIHGEVVKINAPGLKIPHMGWNSLKFGVKTSLLNGNNEGDYVYFVHSYRAQTEDKYILSYTEYGEKIPALVGDGKFVYGAQFHPEKSSDVGLNILKNFGGLIK